MTEQVTQEQIRPYVDALMHVSNLDVNQAKTVLYYCAMTWSDKPPIRPILNITGESETGKTRILQMITSWCYEAKFIKASNKTEAQMRDDLADAKTAIIDEADKTKAPKECENWYQVRYEKTGIGLSYRKQTLDSKGSSISRPETHNHFGFTIMHTQNPLGTPEMDRRTIRIVIFKDSRKDYYTTDIDKKLLLSLITLGCSVGFTKPIEGAHSTGAWDVWLPLIHIADYLGDTAYIEYAKQQIVLKTEDNQETKLYEPKGIVLAEVAELYDQALEVGQTAISITDVRKAIRERECLLVERQIVKLARDLGFTIVSRQNKAFIAVVSRAQLNAILDKAGVNESSVGSLPDSVSLEPVLASVN